MKYQPLSERLGREPAEEWRPTFAEIEAVLGFPLPKTARDRAAWWASSSKKPYQRAWLDAGWHVGQVDPATGVVTFRRTETVAVIQPARATAEAAPAGGLVQRATTIAAVIGGVLAVAAVLAARLRGRKTAVSPSPGTSPAPSSRRPSRTPR